MGFLKDLIFVNEDSDKDDKKETNTSQQSFTNKFPSSSAPKTKKDWSAETGTATGNYQPSATAVAPITPENPACGPHLDNIMGLYENGFDGLDMEGYDFYEFFKMVVGAGANNPAAYNMAFTMAETANATKESLISQSDYYITEINKVHASYSENGSNKKQEALNAKGLEESTLMNELTGINNEIARLNMEKSKKEGQLGLVDSKYTPTLTDIECKIMANNIAKDKIISTITTVVNGIKTNIK
jgi:hypothetical protein